VAAATPRFSPLKSALKYRRRRIREFIAINNEEEVAWQTEEDVEGTAPVPRGKHSDTVAMTKMMTSTIRRVRH